jgi:hypothetical protein
VVPVFTEAATAIGEEEVRESKILIEEEQEV